MAHIYRGLLFSILISLSSIVAQAIPQITVSKTEIEFGEIKLGSEDYNFLSVDLEGAEMGAQVSYTIIGDDSQHFRVVKGYSWYIYFKPLSTGIKSAILRITADGAQPVDVLLNGIGKASNITISVDPDINMFDFGSCLVGQFGTMKVLDITITDPPSDASVQLEGTNAVDFVKSGGGYFDYEGKSRVTIYFNPKSLGNKVADLTITAGSQRRVVKLTGTAITSSEPQIDTDFQNVIFGEVIVGNQVHRHLKVILKNSGSSPTYSIRNNDESLFSASGILAPNAESTLELTFKPKSDGYKSAELIIQDGSIERVITLIASGRTLQPAITTDPTEVIFEDTYLGNTSVSKEVSITVKDLISTPTYKIEGAAAAMFGVNGNLEHTNGTSKLNLTFTPSAIGEQQATLVISSGSIVTYLTIKGKALRQQAPEINVNPTVLDFGNVYLHDYTSKKITITVKYTNETPTAELLGRDKELFNIVSAPQRENMTIQIGFQPSSIGDKEATLRLKVSGASLEVILRGKCESNAPTIQADRSEVVFPITGIGATSPSLGINLLLSDLSEDVQVKVTGADATDFTPSRTTIPRTPKEAFISVTFNPTTVGAKNATVIFSSNTQSVEVRLKGEAKDFTTTLSPSSRNDLSISVYTGALSISTSLPGDNLSIYTINGLTILKIASLPSESSYHLSSGIYLLKYREHVHKLIIP